MTADPMVHAPTVSVLMACYNAERFVGAALESIFNQTFTDFEVVVVDDGSTDKSPSIVRRAQSTHHNLRLIQEPSRGAACARNLALRCSTGRYVLFMDADDLIGPAHLAALVGRLQECTDCVALARWSRFYAEPSDAAFPERPTEKDLPGPDWLELDWRNARPMTQSAMLLLPRSLLEKFGGWDERLTLNDDFEFFARVIVQCSGVRFAPEALLYYRSAIPGSLSAQKSRTAVESAFLSLDLGTRHLLKSKYNDAARKTCANLFADFNYHYFPYHRDLRLKALSRIADLGGSDIEPDGPPGFHRLRPWLGWQIARLVQRAAEVARANVRFRRWTRRLGMVRR